MAENEIQEPEQDSNPMADERAQLLQRAKVLGIKHSPNIGLETLREKIRATLEGQPVPPEEPLAPVATQGDQAQPKPKSHRQQCIDKAMRLVRLRITNLDPKKKDLHGEIITVANQFIGTVRKFVPFGEATDEGFHVPHCIYEFLKERRFLQVKVRKMNGRERVETAYVPEFALEVLPPLTKVELERLGRAQLAAANQ